MENTVEGKFSPNLDIDLLLPRANNIRRIIKPSVKAAIAKTMRDEKGLPEEHALLVRPIGNGKYETISGNTRLMVAREEGLKNLPVWIREMTDDEAFFQTAKVNSHGELTPLEYGLAGLNIPQSKGWRGRKGSISRYAEDIGYDVGTVRRWITCARVLRELGLDEDSQIGKFNDSTTHLSWIATAKREDWMLLIEEVRKGITVDDLRALISPKKRTSQHKSVKEISDILPVKDVKQSTKNAVSPDVDSNKQKEVAVIIPQISSIDSQVINNELQEQFQIKHEPKDNFDWIKSISILGACSIEEDQGSKSNYQAGTDFENIAKKGLEFLGFTIDEAHKGGAGGLDLFCSKPYPLTGECKAGKSISNGAVKQLVALGGAHLGVDQFIKSSVKLVIGAGNPTDPMLHDAQEWKVSIIKAMTLQKLVELKAKYDGGVNLFELKEYLQAGQIDNKIEEYIQKVESEIKLRSYIVQTVKELQDADSEYPSPIEIRTHYNAKKQGANVSLDSTKEMLIELSSPLAGYLGRVKSKGETGDRFYYLRDLPIE